MVKPSRHGARKPTPREVQQKRPSNPFKHTGPRDDRPPKPGNGTAAAKRERRQDRKAGTHKPSNVATASATTIVLREGGEQAERPQTTRNRTSRRGKRSPHVQTQRAAARAASRVIQSNARMTAAASQMGVAREELELFDRVTQTPAFVADPFAAIDEHLSTAMDFLQPQTPDIGRAKKE